MLLSVVVLHPLQLPAGRDLSGPHITESITWINILSKAEYTNTQQDLPVGDNYFQILDMKGFWPLSFFC
jgi:hypothetical protein